MSQTNRFLDENGYFDIDSVNDRFPDEILKTLLGGSYDFYGVDNNAFCIGVGGARVVLEAVEDPSDGYRSYFGCFRTSSVDKIFFREPIARVLLEEGGLSNRTYFSNRWNDDGTENPPSDEDLREMSSNFNGWVLRDTETGHVWLTVGTDHGDDYYPCFTFSYEPDPSRKV
jgi:hypothetical protein